MTSPYPEDFRQANGRRPEHGSRELPAISRLPYSFTLRSHDFATQVYCCYIGRHTSDNCSDRHVPFPQ